MHKQIHKYKQIPKKHKIIPNNTKKTKTPQSKLNFFIYIFKLSNFVWAYYILYLCSFIRLEILFYSLNVGLFFFYKYPTGFL